MHVITDCLLAHRRLRQTKGAQTLTKRNLTERYKDRFPITHYRVAERVEGIFNRADFYLKFISTALISAEPVAMLLIMQKQQTRRQDIAAGGGAKTRRGATF